MWRVLALGVGAVGAFLASKRAWAKIQAGREGADLPVQIIVKGATSFQNHIGPWSVRDLTVTLAAMAKVAEKKPPEPPGQPAEELSKDAEFLARAQHWRAMAEAVYVCDRSSFSLQTQLAESALVHAEWSPDPSSLRPAYAVCLDAPFGAVALAIRGTSHLLDMLLDTGAQPETFRNGRAHAGYAHAARVLADEARSHIRKAYAEACRSNQDTRLVIVGHSMGGAIGILSGFTLREEYPNLHCWSFSTPASLSQDLATESAGFATSVVSAYDVVPRFSLAAVEKLRQQVRDFDWESARELLRGDEEWERLDKGAQMMGNVQDRVGGMVRQAQGGQEEEEEEAKEAAPALYPPGRLLVLAADPPGFGKRPQNRSNVPQQRNYGSYPSSFDEGLHTRWTLREARHDDFVELAVSPWSVSDHMLGNLCEGLAFLQRQCAPILPPPS